jgi:Carboxypeptidase regulatory-like domain
MTRNHKQESSSKHERWYRFVVRCFQRGRRAILGFAAFVFLTQWVVAQATSQLNGSVTDPTGASVAGANITLTETATGFQRKTTSNVSGLYQFVEVPPGSYKLEASGAGFVPFVATNVTLVVKTPSTMNIKFRVEGGTTEVNVEGEAALINRTDASLGNVIENAQISELPIADRNVTYLLSLQPGVAFLGTQINQDTDTRSGAVNGVRSDQSNVTLDGIGVNDQNNGYAFTSVLNAPPDSVEEFRVTTANSNADTGYSSGGQVALVTKSGTNNFHGSAYLYNRNTIFSANDPFLKNSQLTSGQSNTAPKLLRNVFGVTAGGPIVKNRLFFFANYEGRRDAEGSSTLRTVPSPTLAAGNLVYLCQTNPDGSPDITDCPGGTVNGVTGVTPGYYALGPTQIKQIDPEGIGVNQNVLTLLNKYPGANESTAGDGSNTLGFRFSPNVDRSFNTYIARLDYHITSKGSEALFARGEMQNFKEPGPQQFPGQAAAKNFLDDSKGFTVGLISILTPKLINDFHWGFTRQGQQYGGISVYPGVFLSGLDSLVPFTRPTTAFVPVNQFSDSLSWTRGNHSFQFGTDLFFIRNNHISYDNSFSDVQTNVVYLNTGGIANTNSPLDPHNNKIPNTNNFYPKVDSNFGPNYDNAIGIVMGIFSEGDGIYNFARNGSALPQGQAISRRYAINDYEFFGQDSWRINRRLTVTYGLRWVLEAPPYETNGYQVAPCVENASGSCTNQNVADWFNKSAQLATAGQPANNAGEIGFVLGGPKNHGPGMWNWDHKDFSPRIAVAWAPDTGNGWISKVLGKKDQFTLRGGYSIMFDHFGIAVVNSFDQNGSFGLSTRLGNSAGSVTAGNAPRFTCLIPGSAGQSCLPPPCPDLNDPGCLFGPAPAGGFPNTPINTAFAINWGLDQSVKTPYTHTFNFSLARQISARSSLQVAYVGSIGRRLQMQVDMGMPTNLNDPASNTRYFQAATMLSKLAAVPNAQSQTGLGTDVNSVTPIPFFENIFPAWAGANTQSLLTQNSVNCAPGNLPGNPSATQNVYEIWSCYPHNETLSLKYLDLPNTINQFSAAMPNSRFGPYAFYHDQFSSLFAWRNIGTSDYNALQVTYNARWGANLQGQFNYTFSKSFDEASAAARIGPYEGTGGTGSDLNGGGIVINSWDPLALRGLSDFNAFHQVNANLIYQLPFGKGQRFVGSASPLLNALVGGWHVSGIFRWTSGFPITIDNGFTWATNWNIEGDAMPNGPSPKASNPKNVVVNGVSGPDIFSDPVAAEQAFRPEWPGESGVRNSVIGDGMFNIDTGVTKDFSVGERTRVEFSWQAFNVTNSVRYDVRGAQPSLSYDPSQFGRYVGTITTPRFMQFALRFAF